MIYWFKRKYRQIRKTLDFIPLIWNSYDFDYKYSLDLFKKHLEYQAKEMETRGRLEYSKVNAQKIRTAIRLMDKVYDEEYAMEWMDTIDKMYGTTHYDFVEVKSYNHKGEPLYRIKHWNEGARNDEHQKEIDEIRTQMMRESQLKQQRAHKLLWNFIEHNIQRWWD